MAARSVGPAAASSPKLLVLDATPFRIRAVSTTTAKQLLITLHDEWTQTVLAAGDIFRLILTRSDGTYVPWSEAHPSSVPIAVTRELHLLVLYPDTLVSGTSIADSFLCLRKAVVSGRVPSNSALDSPGGEAALFGSMIHALFQRVLVMEAGLGIGDEGRGELDVIEVFEAVEDVVVAHVVELCAARVSERHARSVLHKIVPEIIEWHAVFMRDGENAGAGGEARNGKVMHRVFVADVWDIEEMIWSPVLGLKGKVDASVRVRVDGAQEEIGVLELKTGSSMGYSAVSHTAQVTLYNLLMSDRYDKHVKHGLLMYIRYQEALKAAKEEEERKEGGDRMTQCQTRAVFDQGEKNKSVVSNRAEMVGLVMQRNTLASYLRLDADVRELPPMLRGQEELCAKCFANDSCVLQFKLLENGSRDTAKEGVGMDLFTEKAGHLSAEHSEYYLFWREALAREEAHAGKSRHEIWDMRGPRREALGSCLSNLELVPDPAEQETGSQGLPSLGRRSIATFTRHADATLQGSFLNSGMSAGDFVVVSAEFSNAANYEQLVSTCTWQSALTNGFVKSVTADTVSVAVDRSLAAWARQQNTPVQDVLWRVDAEEIYSSHTTAKRTVETLFTIEAEDLCSLIVDGRSPEFVEDDVHEGEETLVEAVSEKFGLSLNADQTHALLMSLHAKDYLLILGMPGTGKTTTLAAVVLATALKGKTVLLCSHTNAAVDNLLCRFVEMGFTDFIRLGRNLRVVDSRLHPYHISTHCTPGQTLEQLEKALEGPRVVATTCLGINHPIFTRRKKFDMVVIDEASQILQPICIGPLQFAGGPFILVGDHYQLPPLLRAGESERERRGSGALVLTRANELDEVPSAWTQRSTSTSQSLFRRLCERHPQAMVTLSKQYRMAAEIMNLSNALVYGGSLKCGSEAVASQKLNISIEQLRTLSPWLKAVRNPSRRLVFIDSSTTTTSSHEDPGGELAQAIGKAQGETERSNRDNQDEAAIVFAAVEALVLGGLSTKCITVLSPFRAQVRLLKDALRNGSSQSVKPLGDVEVFTVDQYQGKDNECIVLSFVRTNTSVGPLLRDWRRINVAITRAKRKLILVGSAQTLKDGGPVLSNLMHHLISRKLVFPVGS